MRRSLALSLALLSLGVASACARTSATTWGWSSWYREGGGLGDLGDFEAVRSTCLSQLSSTDPAAVAPDSSQETQFIECMNASGWCTQLWSCEKPGA